MKAQVYKDPRPAEHFDRFHERTRTREPGLGLRRSCGSILTPFCLTVFRARCIASENVPASGPVIFAPNHFSFMDHFFVAMFMRRRVRFMAKSQLFTAAGAVHLPPRRRLPGAPRPPRRGGVHHRQHGPRARRKHRHVLRGRALAHRQALGQGEARHRATRARDRRANRADRDLRLAEGARTGSACSSRR